MPVNTRLVDPLGGFNESVGQLQNALRAAPEMQMQQLQLGQAKRAIGEQARHDRENQQIAQAVSGLPDIAQRHHVAAQLLESFGRFDEAQKIKDVDLAAISSLQGSNPEEYHKRIVEHYGLGNVPYAPKPDLMSVPEGGSVLDKNTRQVVASGTPKLSDYEKKYKNYQDTHPGATMQEFDASEKALPGPPPAPSAYGDYASGDPAKMKRATDFAQRAQDPEMRNAILALKNQALAKGKEVAPNQDFTKPLQNAADESAAQQVASGKRAPSQLSRRAKSYDAILARAVALNPNLDLQEAESNFQFGKSTATQNTLRYMESVDKSIDTLSAISKKLERSNIKIFNKAKLAALEQTGNPDVAEFNTAQVELADQVAKILQGGGTGNGTSDAKLKQAIEIFDRSYSPAQLNAAMQVVKSLIKNRKDSMVKGTFMENKGGGETQVINGVTYKKVQGGWQKAQ